MFAPILVGPAALLNRFHPDGELAMVRGASAAKAAMVVASRSSQPVGKIAAEAATPLWFQADPDQDPSAVRSRVEEAVKCGCKAVCLTLGVAGQPSWDWSAIDRLRKGLTVPFLLKGVLSPEEAQKAVERGVQGIIVSSYRGSTGSGLATPIEMLPSIAEAVGGKIPVLIDGSFRRGSDALKALALGARAVLLGRPPLWGLAAYGADGVRQVLQLMQGELARDMAMCGRANVKSVDRSIVRIHRW
jgi:isopentenyl diphosphate isomerase/L-lactate dehydrogenase-like FMN-dependent dehydrogenase